MRDVVVIGASAGGIHAAREIARALPASLPAAVAIVVHRRLLPSVIAEILARHAQLPVQWASDHLPVRAGHIYVAPPDHQVTFERGAFLVDQRPEEGLQRPSINAFFRSAAEEYRSRTIGVILTGSLNDGTAGLWEIKRRGGIAIVQDPEDAEFPHMPINALKKVQVDFVLPLERIGETIVDLVASDGEPDLRDHVSKVLIVEDEAIAATSLAEGLALLGYSVTDRVATGADALHSVSVRPPDIVLMDIQLLGNMTGIEASRKIWTEWQIPTVYVTAFSDPATLEQVNGRECYGYIAKPFHAKAIRAAIELAISRRRSEVFV